MKQKILAGILALTMILTTWGIDCSNTETVRAEEGQIGGVTYEDGVYYAGNPIITDLFTADPSAHVWEENGRIYIYASHDMFPPQGCGMMDRYHIYSSDNMVTWKDEGEILRADQVSWGRSEGGMMWAPDAAHANGKYYFYFPHPTGNDDWNSTWRVGVAVSDEPASGFTCADDGYVKTKDGEPYVTKIDPCIFEDDDGSFYLYTGGGYKCYVAKLQEDMQTLAEDPVEISDTLTDFHEGMWVFKRNGVYYAMYADNTSGHNQLRYSTADSPYGPWKEGGIVLEATSCDTSHGSICEYKGQWYLFYHNSDLSTRGNLRSVCIDKLYFNEDGSIQTVQQTEKGVPAVGDVDPTLIKKEESHDDSHLTIATDYPVEQATVGGGAGNGNGIINNLHYFGSYVQWDDVDGGEYGGRAELKLSYATTGSAIAIVNGTEEGYFESILKFESTGAWNAYSGTSTCYINLKPGKNNTIRLITGMGGFNINQMTVTVSDVPESTTGEPTTEEPTTEEPTTEEPTTEEPTTEEPTTEEPTTEEPTTEELTTEEPTTEETLAKNEVENFELYYGDNDYLNGTFTENSAVGCSSEFVLDSENKASGSYGGSFNYKLTTSGPEVSTGRMKDLDTNDYSEYNAITMWVKPDGKGQKLVVQLVSNGEDFEAILTDFVATTEAKYITIPFDQLKGKNSGTFDAKSITKFAIWCNSIPANGATDLESSIVFDDIQFVNVDASKLSIQNGYAVTDKPVTALNDNGQKDEIKEEIKQEIKAEAAILALDQTAARVKKGETLKLNATVTPADSAVTWKSSDANVATVDSTGTVKAITQGTATITAAITDAKGETVEAKCDITVPYNITYKLNKGKNNAENPDTYYTETVKLKNPTRKGYAFKGWYTDNKFKNKVTKISQSSKKDITLYAKWSKVTVKKASLKSVKAAKKSMKVTVKKVCGAKGYTIVYSTDKKFKKNVKLVTTTKTSKTIKGLKKGKTYYVKVKAYKKDSAGKKVYGKYSKVKQVEISK